MIFRILAGVVLLWSVLFMPFWLSVLLGLGAMIYFSFFWEASILFLLSDLLYGVREVKIFGIFFISCAISVLVLVLLEFLKKKLKFY